MFGAARTTTSSACWRRADALQACVEADDGANLLAAYKRAANILRIEEKKDGHAYDAGCDAAPADAEPEEQALAAALDAAEPPRSTAASPPRTSPAPWPRWPTLRAPVDAFFDKVTVNDPDAGTPPQSPCVYSPRLARRRWMPVADFSKIEA